MGLVAEFIYNPTAQSLLLGPLIGVIFGALLSGLTKSPVYDTPETVIQTQRIYETKIIERKHAADSSNDGIAFFVIIGLALLFLIWKYAIHVYTIHLYLETFILTVLSFSITTMVISLVKGRYTSNDWFFYTISPSVLLFTSLYLLNIANENFDPVIQEGARSNTFWTFYTEWLSSYGQNFMLAHVVGVVVLTFTIVLISVSLIHYLSLMNQRSYGTMREFWLFLTKHTEFSSGKTGFVLMIFLLVIAYIFINPEYAANWLTEY